MSALLASMRKGHSGKATTDSFCLRLTVPAELRPRFPSDTRLELKLQTTRHDAGAASHALVIYFHNLSQPFYAPSTRSLTSKCIASVCLISAFNTLSLR